MKLLLLLCLVASLCSCVTKFESDDFTKSIGQFQQPQWLSKKRFSTKGYFHFVRSFSSDLHTSRFAYRLARKELHLFLREDVEEIFSSLQDSQFKTVKIKLVQECVQFISKRVMRQVRREKESYWQKNGDSEAEDQTIHYIQLKLSKKRLRMLQLQFVFKKMNEVNKKQQKLIEKPFKVFG